MAPWGDAKLFFCLFFITCCCTATSGQMAMDCCLTVKNKVIDKSVVGDYHQQFSGQGCSIDAMVLVTRGGKKLCVTAHQPWLNSVVSHVNHLRKLCKKTPQAKRCKGVKFE